MDFQVFLPIEKVDEEKRMVWGYASTPTKDLQGEVVTLDAIKSALPDYMQWRNIREMHTPSAVGVAKEAHVDDNGLYIGAKIVDDDAWKKCKEQVYKGFSIGGSKLEKVGDTIKQLRLTEISLVDRPANPDCKIDAVKVVGVIPRTARTADTGLFAKFLDVCKSIMPTFGADGFSAPVHSMEAPAHAALEGHQPQVIPLRVDNSDPHPSNAMQTDLRQPGAETPGAQRVELTHAELADLHRKLAEVEFEKREFSDKERKHLAAQGIALPDGSFPIANEGDLKNAVHAFDRAGDKDKAKAHITARAKALKLTHLLPADWPGSTKEEKAMIPEELAKRASAASKASLGKAHEHLKKAVACHGKACEALNNLHKCMGKADGAAEHETHLRSLASALSSMGDHHDIALHHLGKVASSFVGETKETPKVGEGGDVSNANTEAVDLLAHGHVSEDADTTGMFATNSPYSAAALTAEIAKQVMAATKPLQDKLAETEKQLEFQKGQMSVLEKLPAGGPRPRLMSGAEVFPIPAGDPKSEVNARINKSWQDFAGATAVGDDHAAIHAGARIIGEIVSHPGQFAKKLTDPDFKGAVGR
jgi:hypothetical protein